MIREFRNLHSVVSKRRSLGEEFRVHRVRNLSGKWHFLVRFCTSNWSETYAILKSFIKLNSKRSELLVPDQVLFMLSRERLDSTISRERGKLQSFWECIKFKFYQLVVFECPHQLWLSTPHRFHSYSTKKTICGHQSLISSVSLPEMER